MLFLMRFTGEIESCMSGGFARLLVMFNPRAEVGEAYRMIRDKKGQCGEAECPQSPECSLQAEMKYQGLLPESPQSVG